MYFAFTTTDHWSSQLIRWGLEEEASHFAVVYKDWVYHATFPEFKRQPLNDWGAKIVQCIEFPHLTTPQKDAVMHNIVKHFHGDAYDFVGLAYFSYRAFLRKAFACDWPDRNHWNMKEPICTELAEAIYEILPSLFDDHVSNMAIKSPMWIYKSMMATGLARHAEDPRIRIA